MPRRKLNVPELVGNPNDPQGMAVMLARYLEWMRTKNYSENTVLGFHGMLARFIVWADERSVVRPNEVTKPIMERYQRYLYHLRKPNGDPLSFKTQACCLTAMRSWFKWLSRNNHVLYNPCSDLDMPRLGRRLSRLAMRCCGRCLMSLRSPFLLLRCLHGRALSVGSLPRFRTGTPGFLVDLRFVALLLGGSRGV